MMKKIGIFLAAILLAAALCFVYSPNRAESQEASSPPAQELLAEVEVVVLRPEEVKIPQELNGRVTPYLIAEVRPQVNGIILKRMFEEGSDVQKDVQLYQIDPAMYEAELNRAQAGLEKARANVDVAEAKQARYQRLIEARAVNQQEYDEVEAATKQARAEVTIAEAEVRLARINVDYAKVLSPISGRIGKSSVTQGALVTASQATPLAVVQQLDPIYVDVSQPISWMMNLKDDMQAGLLQNTGKGYAEMRVLLDNGQPYSQRGKLLFADVTVDQTTGSISLRAEFPNPNHVLLPGMYVRALLDVAQKNDAITVPMRSVQTEHDGRRFVMVVNPDKTVERRHVTVIRNLDGDRVLVGDELKAGEQVVYSGSQRIIFAPGAPAPKVNPIPVEWRGQAVETAKR